MAKPGSRRERVDAVHVMRGGVVESAHAVHAAVVDPRGRRVASLGEPERVTFFRSSAKPFQCLPLVEDGLAEAHGLTAREIAVCCASHNAEPGHLDLVRSVLERAGLGEDALLCGPHAPLHEPTSQALAAAGGSPRPIHNNCSGKHAGMLLLAAGHGWTPTDYVDPGHPVQRRMLGEIARWTGLPESAIATGVDGCGVVCFAVPVTAMARAYAAIGLAARSGGAAGRVVEAMTANPWVVAGSGRLCTDLMSVAGGDVLAKLGAEGVYGAAWLSRGWGIGVKVEDGSRRALEVALVELLRQLGALGPDQVAALEGHGAPPVLNTLGEVVGGIRPAFELEWC